ASALRFAHELRATHDAVLVGIGTLLQDDPRLTVRHVEGPDPLKIVLDSRARTPSSAALLRETPTRTIVLTTPAAATSDVARLGADLILSGDLAAERAADPANGSSDLKAVLVASASLPTQHGPFELRSYDVAGREHPVLVLGDPRGEPAPLVRLHSECLTGE